MHVYQNSRITSISTRNYLKYDIMYYYYVAIYCVSFRFVFHYWVIFPSRRKVQTILIIMSSIYCIINRHQTYTSSDFVASRYYIDTTALQTTFDCYNIIVYLYISTCAVFCVRANYFNIFSSFTQNQIRGGMTAVYIVYLLPTFFRHIAYSR
jgi:hypothetical protein